MISLNVVLKKCINKQIDPMDDLKINVKCNTFAKFADVASR